MYVTFPSDNEQSTLAIFLEASSFVCAVKPDEVLTECAFCEKKRKEKKSKMAQSTKYTCSIIYSSQSEDGGAIKFH